jgi:hypothetical protein
MAHRFDPVYYQDKVAQIASAKDAIGTLNTIIANADTATTAQLRSGMKAMAKYEKALIKITVNEIIA